MVYISKFSSRTQWFIVSSSSASAAPVGYGDMLLHIFQSFIFNIIPLLMSFCHAITLNISGISFFRLSSIFLFIFHVVRWFISLLALKCCLFLVLLIKFPFLLFHQFSQTILMCHHSIYGTGNILLTTHMSPVISAVVWLLYMIHLKQLTQEGSYISQNELKLRSVRYTKDKFVPVLYVSSHDEVY